ncbi:2,3-dehydroadipyl-CoA hydratase [bioreactor metagenome]|uniref:2,3-dehydroadipyl-CoA hydratase n=1 Tax=bioreactor metagenome TaxID=1076179 RepID=A0A645FNN9_9ZZZZ
MGLLMKVVPFEELHSAVMGVVAEMRHKGPLSLCVAKKLLNAALDVDLNAGLLMENLGFGVLLDSEDKLEGINAFLEKRSPAFQGK